MTKAMYEGISNVARTLKNPSFGVGNVSREAKNGYFGVGNVAREFLTPLDYKEAIDALSVGEIIDLPTKSYGNVTYVCIGKNVDGAGTTTLMTKYLSYGTYAWNSSNVATNYSNSSIRSYLNTSIFGNFVDEVKYLIKPVNKVSNVCNGFGDETSVINYCWLPSHRETCGSSLLTSESWYSEYFKSGDTNASDKIMTDGTTAQSWWIRNPTQVSGNQAWTYNASGSVKLVDFATQVHFPVCIVI